MTPLFPSKMCVQLQFVAFKIHSDKIDDHLEECLMEKWKCTNECGHSVLRAKKDFHLARCSHRLVECQFCSKQVNLHKRGAHHEECPQKPLLCTNKCGKRILRSAMEEHCRDDCPKQLVDCAYCGKSIARKFLVDHMAETKPHIEFLVNTTKQLEVRLLEMEKKMTKQLEVRLLEMEKKMTKEFKSFEHQLVETQKKMTKNLEDRLLEAKEETLSEENSFIWFLRYTSRNAAYTSPEFCVKGYRFTVSLQASNNNTNMGVYFTLQKGSNDDVLPWPFRAKIWFQILNPTENRGHKKSLVMNTALADEKSIAESWQQPGHYGRGYPCFILKTDIPKYLKNSVLTIQTHVRLCEEWRFSGKVAGQ